MPSFGDTRLPERFWDKLQPEPMSGCWLWTASLSGGYGHYDHGRAHRIAYLALVGPTPMQLDHKCRVRSCCNPEHLEPVTSRENTMRGSGLAAQEAARTHCPRGHALSGSNLVASCLRRKGKRNCKQCARLHTQKWRASRQS